jgi:integration host factor subunit alpha
LTITKKIIQKKIAIDINVSMEDSSKILELFLQSIKSNAKCKQVKLSKFGSFTFKQTPERLGRNPKTGKNFTIKSFKRLIFKPSYRLKNIIN